MSDWIKELAERKRREIGARELRERKALSDRELIAQGAPAAWERIREIAESARRELVAELGEENVYRLQLDGKLLLFLSWTGSEIYRIVFDAALARVGTPERSYRMVVDGANELLWMPDPDNNTGPVRTEAIAEMAVANALRRL